MSGADPHDALRALMMMGPGLVGGGDHLRPTARTAEQKEQLRLRQKAAFVPRRCEVVGCTITEIAALSSCAQCKCVSYCSLAHQKQDWPRHKTECKHVAKAALQAIHYRTDEELAKYPLGCFPLPDVDLSAAQCFMCGAGATEVNLGYTRCCHAVVCDNEHEYQMMSYSRDHCARSHARYTTCGSHESEGHSGADWRTCRPCLTSTGGIDARTGTRSWYSTNGFNVTPAFEDQLPKGSNFTYKCADSSCKTRILPGHETETGSRTCMTHVSPGSGNRGGLFSTIPHIIRGPG